MKHLILGLSLYALLGSAYTVATCTEAIAAQPVLAPPIAGPPISPPAAGPYSGPLPTARQAPRGQAPRGPVYRDEGRSNRPSDRSQPVLPTGRRDTRPSERPNLAPPVLSKRDLREIDRLAVQLVDHARELHDEYHEHLEGVRHAEKLERDITLLTKIAKSLHRFVETADGSDRAMKRLRADTNQFLQLASRIVRTIDLTSPRVSSHHAHEGIRHMRSEARDVVKVALRIDRYLPVDTEVIDQQADDLEEAIKELHDEFHEHLEGYEVSRHLDEDLEELEELVEHLHDLSHGKDWKHINLRHVSSDLRKIVQKTEHLESLFERQARIGVRTRDWAGIEHSRDAITDVLASAGLLNLMIEKASPSRRAPHDSYDRPRDSRDRLDSRDRYDDRDDHRPLKRHHRDRDRDHGHSHHR